jgi:hypothetical protein
MEDRAVAERPNVVRPAAPHVGEGIPLRQRVRPAPASRGAIAHRIADDAPRVGTGVGVGLRARSEVGLFGDAVGADARVSGVGLRDGAVASVRPRRGDVAEVALSRVGGCARRSSTTDDRDDTRTGKPSRDTPLTTEHGPIS